MLSHMQKYPCVFKHLIFVSLESWDAVWRRNQFICHELVRRNPGLTILFVEPARDVSNTLRTKRWHQLKGKRVRQAFSGGNIFCLRPLKWLPGSLPGGRKFNEWHLRRQIKTQMKRLRMNGALLWVNAHQACHLAGTLETQGLIYDITDDWTSFGSMSERLVTQAQDAMLCRQADAVIVCSQRLYELKRAFHERVHLIPNGVDAAYYRRVLDGTGPLPAAAAQWEKPVFGYVGTVHHQRVDVPLVTQVAGLMTRGSIVLIGPSHLDSSQADSLLRTGRVHFVGAVPYREVPEYMRAFDVCMVPHVVSAFTESLNPIKLWEYLAAGKPIVSTDIAGFRDFPQHVSIAKTALEFLKACESALHESHEKPSSRRDEAAKHGWTSRVELVEEVIGRVLSNRSRKMNGSRKDSEEVSVR